MIPVQRSDRRPGLNRSLKTVWRQRSNQQRARRRRHQLRRLCCYRKKINLSTCLAGQAVRIRPREALTET
jgi:hypothetical protein